MIAAAARAARAARWIAAATVLAVASACTSPSSPTVGAPFTIIDLRAGTGAAAESGMTLMVNYKGWLYDATRSDNKGQLFDESREGFPFVFKLGVAQVIEGWDVGLLGLKVGGLRKLIIPSDMAYGRNGAGTSIPPNATLVFEVELLSAVTGPPTGG
jgi:FKBP-type peptidyl-prolyl cis-trans isomerase FkpA